MLSIEEIFQIHLKELNKKLFDLCLDDICWLFWILISETEKKTFKLIFQLLSRLTQRLQLTQLNRRQKAFDSEFSSLSTSTYGSLVTSVAFDENGEEINAL